MKRCHDLGMVAAAVAIALAGVLLPVALPVLAAAESDQSPATVGVMGAAPSPGRDDAAKQVKPKPARPLPKAGKARDAESSTSRGIAIEPARREEPDVGVGGLSREAEQRPETK